MSGNTPFFSTNAVLGRIKSLILKALLLHTASVYCVQLLNLYLRARIFESIVDAQQKRKKRNSGRCKERSAAMSLDKVLAVQVSNRCHVA